MDQFLAPVSRHWTSTCPRLVTNWQHGNVATITATGVTRAGHAAVPEVGQ